MKKKKDLYLRWLNTKSDEDRNEYELARKETRKEVLKKKRDTWDRKCKKIDTYIGRIRCTEAWKFIRKVRSNNRSKNDITQTISAKKWIQHFKKLLQENRNEYANEDEQIAVEGKKVTIDVEKITKAITKKPEVTGTRRHQCGIVKKWNTKAIRDPGGTISGYINGQEIPNE